MSLAIGARKLSCVDALRTNCCELVTEWTKLICPLVTFLDDCKSERHLKSLEPVLAEGRGVAPISATKLSTLLPSAHTVEGNTLKRLVSSLVLFALSTLALMCSAHAEPQRFRVEGSRLFYDPSVALTIDGDENMTIADAEQLALFVMEEQQIDTIVLESPGGSGVAGMRMAATIMRFGLDTEVYGQCFSACAVAFIAGATRTLAPGGSLGFHRSWVDAGDTRSSFARSNPMISQDQKMDAMYEMAVVRSVEVYGFMLRRGIRESFILRVMGTPPREVYYPTRRELIEAGVLDD